MHVKILKDSKRRIAYTDRKDGYFEYLMLKEAGNNGYFRSNVQYLKGFSCEGHALCESNYVNVYPEGIRAFYNRATLDVSLLIDEQAFYLSTNKNAGILGIVTTTIQKDDLPVAENGQEDVWSKVSVKETRKVPSWSVSRNDDIFVVSSNTGIAIAADFDFYHAFNGEDIELYVTNGEISDYSDGFFANKGWYITFEENEELAIEKAVRLVKENAVKKHLELVGKFVEKYAFDCGDEKFNQAVQWSRFSAWLLATKDHGSGYRGIWAGLPWFRDNWGRDTFISLCGTLLVSGCFEEAKDVLKGFAGFQDLNESSPSYGRIPNRYRDANDVIYNTADGTLWFIRALWEYVGYSGDFDILKEMQTTIERAIEADIKRCDQNGFLMHGDADTWMDARIQGDKPWSPRGNRANDIQALWFTALKIVAEIEELFENKEKAKQYNELAQKVKDSFTRLFWNEDCSALADHLPEGGYGEWAKDMRVRPNQLFALTVPSILQFDKNNRFVDNYITDKVLQNVDRELVSPFGLFSLSPEDPLFHPEHNDSKWYHKDAAYHNGTIWEWNSGPYVSACALNSEGALPQKASALIQNEAKMIMEHGCVGSLSENIHARPDEDGNPSLSGTFSQSWSVAEFNRNITQDIIGFKPNLIEKKIYFAPCLPLGCEELKAAVPFGNNWIFEVQINRKGKKYNSKIQWIIKDSSKSNLELYVNDTLIEPNKEYEIVTSFESKTKVTAIEKFGIPTDWITEPFTVHNFDNPFCGSERKENYLQDLINSGRPYSHTSGGENTAALEWYFESEDFKKNCIPDSDFDLGALYTTKSTTFRLWSPNAKNVTLLLFNDAQSKEPYKEIAMSLRCDSRGKGTWETEVKGNLDGIYYLYKVLIYGVEQLSSDPYARACSVNGTRAMVVNLLNTNPKDWNKVQAPVVTSPSDVIAYEAHIADITSSPAWGGQKDIQRTFLGACQEGTSYNGIKTGFDHIKELGVTHVQLLPVFDFRSVDERNVNDPEVRERPTFGAFNWGYDPENYACLEGSYSTNPYDGAVRIKEFKEMVKAYSQAGIGIIMDVVYNHVNDGLHQALGTSIPGYFFRVEGYSGAGEDTASEHEMFRKYMVDTLCYWLKEYKLSGFRFDLMGLHDTQTMNEIAKALRKIKKDVLIYGEGWDMYRAGKMKGASQTNCEDMNEIGFFNDALRDAIKGPVFDSKSKGYIHDGSRREAVKFGIVGATNHPQVDFTKVEGTAAPKPWGTKTWLSVNYTEIHDNITLRDKIFMTEQDKSEEYYDQMQKMALSFVLLSQGYPILHAGMEFCRTKEVPEEIKAKNPTFYEYSISDDGAHFILHNTYNVCDKINGLDWARCANKKDVFEYTKNLIKLRKEHPAFRLSTEEECKNVLLFLDNKRAGLPEQTLAWTLDGSLCGDSWKKILIIANPFDSDISIELKDNGTWQCVTDGCCFIKNPDSLSEGTVIAVKPKCVAVYALL